MHILLSILVTSIFPSHPSVYYWQKVLLTGKHSKLLLLPTCCPKRHHSFYYQLIYNPTVPIYLGQFLYYHLSEEAEKYYLLWSVCTVYPSVFISTLGDTMGRRLEWTGVS